MSLMLSRDQLETLRRLLGPDSVLSGAMDREVYSYDASLVTGVPAAIVLPADTDQTAAVLRELARFGVPAVVRGFGTNLSGGSVVAEGGVVVSTARLNRILTINTRGRWARVQAGVTNLELQAALAARRFCFAPDPASQKVSTLGGNLGENSGGPHCVKYGVTTNHVLGLTTVLADGRVVSLGGPALDPPGLDLRGVFIGSEGAFGIATEVVVRILPLPAAVKTLLAIYDGVAAAARSVSDMIAAGLVPATLEMMDTPIINAVEDSMSCGYPRDAAAVLIVEVDGVASGLAEQAKLVTEVCSRNGCRAIREAQDAAERDRLWAGRRGAFGAIARITPNYLVTDCTVPRSKLPEALAHVGRIGAKYDLRTGNVFHAGDGNLHPLLFFDSRQTEQVERVHRAGWEIMEACVALGGTISGEHGIGVEKRQAMRLVFSEDDLGFQRAVKRAFDPGDRLNPGKVLPPIEAAAPSQRPAGTVAETTPAPAPDAILQADAELCPETPQAACRLVKQALRDGLALAIAGCGTLEHVGNRLAKPTVRLRSTRLGSVIEYDHVNQVVTVGAGMRLTALQAELARHDQWLPLRPPRGERHSIGGCVALGACGPDRLRYGAPRDLLLGLKFVSATGQLITAGGKVVKNVAGFDITRLLAGSLGTLGFLTELTFRAWPLPKACRLICGTGSWSQCAEAAARALESDLEPVMLVTPGPTRLTADAPTLLTVGFEGFEASVQDQAARGTALLTAAGLTPGQQRTCQPAEDSLGAVWDSVYAAPFVLRLDVPPDAMTDLPRHLPAALWRSPQCLIDWGCGRATWGCEEMPDALWQAVGEASGKLQGQAVIEKAPADFAARVDLFGPPRPEWKLFRDLKNALDPRGVFAPGRLPGRA